MSYETKKDVGKMQSFYRRADAASESKIRVRIFEDMRTEFKHSLNPDNARLIAETINALMNSEGGKLIIGIDETGEVIGLNPTLKSLSLQKPSEVASYIITIVERYIGKEHVPPVSPAVLPAGSEHYCEVYVIKSPELVSFKD